MRAYQKATYGIIVVGFWPQKYDTYQTRLTVGENLIDYPGELRAPTANMLTSKLIFNSTISNLGELFIILYLEKFYLNIPMDRY